MANGLGRGLGSLIPQKNSDDQEKVKEIIGSVAKDQVITVNPDLIVANPHQPRHTFNSGELDELKQSIEEHGIIQPLVVTHSEKGYELIAGERRLRAARELKLRAVPIVVREANDQTKLELALIENIQREDLNAIELANAYKQLSEEFNLNQEQLAKKLGKSRPVITNTLRILQLPDVIQEALINGEITEGHAKILVGLDSERKQFELFNRIRTRRLTVDDTLLEARRMGGTKKARVLINHQDKDKEMQLRQFFGTKTEIKRVRKGGQVIIYFNNEEELEGIVDKVDSL